jgi:hypothetical protein
MTEEPKPAPSIPRWLSRTVVTLLAAQLALLWTHGSMLQRQHEDLQSLRDDIQALSESLDQEQDGWDDGSGQDGNSAADPALVPARRLRHLRARKGRPALLRVQDPGEQPSGSDQQAAKDLADSLKSGKDAVAQARKVQSQLSIEENYRKAEEKAKAEGEFKRWLPWAAFLGAVGAGAMMLRGWLRTRS